MKDNDGSKKINIHFFLKEVGMGVNFVHLVNLEVALSLIATWDLSFSFFSHVQLQELFVSD